LAGPIVFASQAAQIEEDPRVARYHAPGRVNLIGEHTDYAGGLVLLVAIDRGVTVTCEPAGRIRLRSTADPARVEGFGRYVEALAAELEADGITPAGIDGRIDADLPVGAGLASSAALLVAVGLALLDAAGAELDPMRLADACRRAEERAVGVPCGIMDQAVAILAEPGCALLLDCGSLAHRQVSLPAGLGLVVADSRTPRRLADTGYATRRAELERALAGDLDATTSRRLRHFHSENARVEAAAAALEAGDVDALGAILAAGHASLRDDYEVSTPELDLLVALALGAGAWAARMTGGGFGGAIVALAPEERCPAIAAAVADGYREAAGIVTEPIVARSAGGAGRLD
jgi:galactokinase